MICEGRFRDFLYRFISIIYTGLQTGVGLLKDIYFFFLFKATDLVLRKVINFSDCTVCLDKRNASGKIEFYQDPLLYKCSFTTRLHFTYDNLNSKMPSIIKVSTFSDLI